MAIMISPNELLAEKLRDISRAYAVLAKISDGLALRDEIFEELTKRAINQIRNNNVYSEFLSYTLSEIKKST